MSKITDYPLTNTLEKNDVFLIDGSKGTRAYNKKVIGYTVEHLEVLPDEISSIPNWNLYGMKEERTVSLRFNSRIVFSKAVGDSIHIATLPSDLWPSIDIAFIYPSQSGLSTMLLSIFSDGKINIYTNNPNPQNDNSWNLRNNICYIVA